MTQQLAPQMLLLDFTRLSQKQDKFHLGIRKGSFKNKQAKPINNEILSTSPNLLHKHSYHLSIN